MNGANSAADLLSRMRAKTSRFATPSWLTWLWLLVAIGVTAFVYQEQGDGTEISEESRFLLAIVYTTALFWALMSLLVKCFHSRDDVLLAAGVVGGIGGVVVSAFFPDATNRVGTAVIWAAIGVWGHRRVTDRYLVDNDQSARDGQGAPEDAHGG